MTEDEIRIEADKVLRDALQRAGYDYVEVKTGLDQDEAPALYVTAVLKPKSSVVDGRTFSAALTALSDALLARGESRFPYLRLHHPDDVRAPDEPRRKAS